MVVLAALTVREMRSETGVSGGLYGDRDFFGFKIGIQHDESVIPGRESRNEEGAIPI